MFFEKIVSCKDHAGSADAALSSSFLKETLLDRVEPFVDGEALNGGDLGTFGLQDGDEAGVDEVAVHKDGASSALAFSAAFFGSGEMEVFAKHIEQPLHRRCFDGSLVLVDAAVDSRHAVASLKIGPAIVTSRDSVPASGTRVRPSKMSSGRRGISANETPMACSIALRMAGAGPSMGSSPMPLAPSGPWDEGTSSKVTWIGGMSTLVGMM